jgi:hypothetical protein
MLLPSRGFHDGGDRCASRLSQHTKDGFLFGAATGWPRNTPKLCRSIGASSAAPWLGFTAFFAVQHLRSLGYDGTKRRHCRSPTVATGPAGRDPDKPNSIFSFPTLTLYWRRQSSPFRARDRSIRVISKGAGADPNQYTSLDGGRCYDGKKWVDIFPAGPRKYEKEVPNRVACMAIADGDRWTTDWKWYRLPRRQL